MTNKILRIEDLHNLSTETLIEAYKNGYRIEETGHQEEHTEFKKLSACTSSIVQNTSKTITMTPSGGTSPYKLEFLVDNVVNSSWTGITGAQTFTHAFSESVGYHRYSVRLTDSCSSPKVVEDYCNINITAPPAGTISIMGCSSIQAGTTCTPVVSCKDGSGNTVTCPALTWSSSNTNVATVNSSGVITGVAAGTATITASATGYTSSSITVTVTAACGTPSVTLTI